MASTGKDRARVQYAYAPQYPDSDELTLHVGDIVEIVSRESEADGWLMGECNGKLGVFPASHVVAIPKSTPVAPAPPPMPFAAGQPTPSAAAVRAGNAPPPPPPGAAGAVASVADVKLKFDGGAPPPPPPGGARGAGAGAGVAPPPPQPRTAVPAPPTAPQPPAPFGTASVPAHAVVLAPVANSAASTILKTVAPAAPAATNGSSPAAAGAGAGAGAVAGAKVGATHDAIRRRQTLIGLYAHYSALLSASFYCVTGVVLLAWGGWGFSPSPAKDGPQAYWALDAVLGLWAMFAGFGIVLYEIGYGKARGGVSRVPWRGIIYALIATPGIWALPTGIGAGTLFIPALANCYSAYLGEFYRPPLPAKRPAKGSDQYGGLTGCARALACLGGRNPDRQIGRLVFLVCYIAANIVAGAFNAKAAYDQIQSVKDFNENNRLNPQVPPIPDKEYQSYWVCVAKFFGNVMNLNYSIILIPVSHSLMRWLVDNSRSRVWYAYPLRAVLWLFPVDDAIRLHRTIAWVAFSAAIGHTIAHLLNYVQKSQLVWDTFGPGIWVTGIALVLIIFIVYPATHVNVKRGHFEIFWVTHMLYVPLFILTLIHGKGMWGPNYWKFLLGPGVIYIGERIYREVATQKPVTVISATFMSNSVLSIVVAKSGALASYSEGQYAYLCCPAISGLQWHPFTISSAPQEDCVSFHIRVQDRGSWTYKLREFFRVLGAGSNRTCLKLAHLEDGRAVPGLIEGPNGVPLLRIHGPYSAPTQHFCEYNEVVVCASGIGATPLASALKSIAHFRWRFAVDRAFPDSATFVWVAAHKEIPSFRWLVRTIKEAEDAVVNLRSKTNNAADTARRRIKFHIYVTSYSKAEADRYLRQSDEERGAEDAGLWGLPYTSGDSNVSKQQCSFTEGQLYAALMNPKEGAVEFGNVTVTLGRPNWEALFGEVQQRTKEKDVGVTFCGNPLIASDIKAQCLRYSYKDDRRVTWHLHKEVF